MKTQNLLLLILSFIILATHLHAQDLEVHGYLEGAFGSRTQSNTLLQDREYTLNESRIQMQVSHRAEAAEFFSAVDLLSDNIDGNRTQIQIREAFLQFYLGDNVDAKIGRQVLTWGTGDLVFINDLFPKDYISFFAGREDQYLKLPSDAIKLRFFAPAFDADVIVMPHFTPNQLPTGQRLSYFHPLAGQRVGQGDFPQAVEPQQKPENAEVALRIHKYLGSFHTAGYLFRGFHKDPMGIDPIRGMYYPKLTAYGWSIRGPFWSGIMNIEYGYYDSREDRDGVNSLIPNSQHRYLAGFERQWWTDMTLGVQYYGEYMQKHDDYLSTLPAGAPEFDQVRHLFSARLTQLLHYQTVRLSLFGFYSPTDEDLHIRPAVSYNHSDQLSITAGANLFSGEKDYTLFGQFEDNNNIYTRVRYYF